MTEGDGRFIVGGAVLVVRRNGADAPLKVSNGIISSVTRAGYAYLRGGENSGFKLIQGCSAAWERSGEGSARAPAWIVPDTPANRKLYADALRTAERTRATKPLFAALDAHGRDESAAKGP